jgi:hypothetical protein
MFSKKRIKRILKKKHKSYTKKKIKKNKKYKKHNSFRKKKNNLRIQTIKKNKKYNRNQKNKKHYRKKLAKKRKAYIHKGGKKLKISNIFISNKNNIDSLNKFITIKKTDEQNIQFGGAKLSTDNTSQKSILEKYFPVNFLKDKDKLIIKLLKDDDIQKTTQSESNNNQETSDKKAETKRAEAKKVKTQLPSSCNTSKFTHGTSGMWIVAPPSSECSNLDVKKKLKTLLNITYTPDVLLSV